MKVCYPYSPRNSTLLVKLSKHTKNFMNGFLLASLSFVEKAAFSNENGKVIFKLYIGLKNTVGNLLDTMIT